MSRAAAENIGRVNAETAIDQRSDYESIEHAFASYRDNVRDTLQELGLTEFSFYAYRVFDAIEAEYNR